MPDLEKVNAWLRGVFRENPTICPCGDCDTCPYYGEDECYKELRNDALALLKEQEAVEPHQAEAVIWHAGIEHIYLIDTCGSCNERIEEDDVFCSRCGRRILWQGR